MNIIIQSNRITPDMLRTIANNLEETWLTRGYSQAKYQILSDKETLSELCEYIQYDADTARDELDDVVIWLRGLNDLYDIAIKELEEKFPTENIKAYFEDIKEYHKLIVPHANEARDVVIAINTTIDPEYQYSNLPTYTVIT
jgi:hypothetical protein